MSGSREIEQCMSLENRCIRVDAALNEPDQLVAASVGRIAMERNVEEEAVALVASQLYVCSST